MNILFQCHRFSQYWFNIASSWSRLWFF